MRRSGKWCRRREAAEDARQTAIIDSLPCFLRNADLEVVPPSCTYFKAVQFFGSGPCRPAIGRYPMSDEAVIMLGEGSAYHVDDEMMLIYQDDNDGRQNSVVLRREDLEALLAAM